MEISADHLCIILGVKLKNFRHEKGLSLKDLAEKTGLSISYLSEIEKGKKYPKPEKIIQLAAALGVSFDDLVSMKVDEALNPLKAILDSPFIQGFPFHLFGIHPKEILHLVMDAPDKARALVRTFLDIGRLYDVRVEHFLFAALRSFQQISGNYFEEIETAVLSFLEKQGWQEGPSVTLQQIQRVLQEKFKYQLDETTLEHYPELREYRSVWVNSRPPKLLINSRLMPSQKAFILAREIGYCYLGLEERSTTSSWIRVESFEQVLNNFKASYFAGALMMHRDSIKDDLTNFFQNQSWKGDEFLAIMQRYNATPEMFFYRLTELLPQLFGFKSLYFMRFSNAPLEGDTYRLTKVFNMSEVPVPHGTGVNEHYCRRWSSIRLLKELAQTSKPLKTEESLVRVERTQFLGDSEFFVFTMARPLALSEGTNSSVSLAFLLDQNFQEKVRFWEDPTLQRIVVNLTCERCPLAPEQCQDRVAPPTAYLAMQNQERRERVLDQLIQDLKRKG